MKKTLKNIAAGVLIALSVSSCNLARTIKYNSLVEQTSRNIRFLQDRTVYPEFSVRDNHGNRFYRDSGVTFVLSTSSGEIYRDVWGDGDLFGIENNFSFSHQVEIGLPTERQLEFQKQYTEAISEITKNIKKN